MNGENKPIGPAPLPDNTPSPFGGPPTPPPPPSSGSSRSTPAGASGPPPPPPPQIDIRTMASDRESLQRSGGLGTEPKTFSPADLSKEPVFNTGITSPAGVVEKGAGGKKIGIAVGAIAILALAGAIGYYLVWPNFSGKEEPQVTKVTPPALLPAEPTPPAPTSQSFFTKPAASTEQINLSTLTLAELSGALKTQPGEESMAAGTVKEVILKVNNASATSSALLNVLVPGTGLESMLESGATNFVYYDAKGAWPGYVFKLKSGTNPAAAQTSTAKIEQSTSLAALYLASPGTASTGGFKNGSAGAIKTRYLSFASGASFNYGWVNNYLVISTSFDGFKKAAALLPSQ